jgi:hypothetical protein
MRRVTRSVKRGTPHAYEGQRRYGKEIHCGNRFTVIAQECVHRFADSGFLGALRIQRKTALSEISKPSIFSSPWMRGAPHVPSPSGK